MVRKGCGWTSNGSVCSGWSSNGSREFLLEFEWFERVLVGLQMVRGGCSWTSNGSKGFGLEFQWF